MNYSGADSAVVIWFSLRAMLPSMYFSPTVTIRPPMMVGSTLVSILSTCPFLTKSASDALTDVSVAASSACTRSVTGFAIALTHHGGGDGARDLAAVRVHQHVERRKDLAGLLEAVVVGHHTCARHAHAQCCCTDGKS